MDAQTVMEARHIEQILQQREDDHLLIHSALQHNKSLIQLMCFTVPPLFAAVLIIIVLVFVWPWYMRDLELFRLHNAVNERDLQASEDRQYIADVTKDLEEVTGELSEKARDNAKLTHELLQVNGTLSEKLRDNADLTQKLQQAHEELEDTSAVFGKCNANNALLNNKLEAAQFRLDRHEATLVRAKEELAARANEADYEAKLKRVAKRHDLKTLFHGLQWMWKFDAEQKERQRVAKTLEDLKKLFEDLKMENVLLQTTVDDLLAKTQSQPGFGDALMMLLASMMGFPKP